MFKDMKNSRGTMTDQKQQLCMQLISILDYSAYQNKNYMLHIVGACRNVQMTLDHGNGPCSGVNFAVLGVLVVAVQGDFETAAKLAEIGLEMQKAHPELEGVCIFLAYSYVLCWKKTLQTCLQPITMAMFRLRDLVTHFIPVGAYTAIMYACRI